MGIGVMYTYASTSFSSLVLHDNIIHIHDVGKILFCLLMCNNITKYKISLIYSFKSSLSPSPTSYNGFEFVIFRMDYSLLFQRFIDFVRLQALKTKSAFLFSSLYYIFVSISCYGSKNTVICGLLLCPILFVALAFRF